MNAPGDDLPGGRPDDDRLSGRLDDAARAYHTPPATPREAMWSAIGAGRARRRAASRRTRVRITWGLALAATLVLGIGIGRILGPGGPFRAAAVPGQSAAAGSPTAYRVAAGQYLVRTEILLTDFRALRGHGGPDAAFLASARDLLSTTRLMLDSPAGDDPRLASLLQDLELVLAQISQLTAEPGQRSDLDLIDQSITRSTVLTRLRAATPGSAALARSEGAL